MMTGFIRRRAKILNASVASLGFVFGAHCAHAADIVVAALFNGKAVLVIDGGKPRTLSVGQSTPEGVRLVAANSESAVIEYNGQRQKLTTGAGTRIGGTAAGTAAGQATLTADSRGHFITTGAINGVSVRFIIDTGASSVALSSVEARRLGVNYLAGTRVAVSTASTKLTGYRVQLDTVRVGDITLNNVEGIVLEGQYPELALLGMSFLNRTQMNREGDRLTLVRRY
jgi:aspartyl protease family protein